MSRSYHKARKPRCRHFALVTNVLLAVIVSLTAWRVEGAGADLVDITAEFRCTNQIQIGNRQYPEQWSQSVHCVVGTNLWYITGNLSGNANITLLFTGTNIFELDVLNKGFTAGKSWTNSWPSDGVVSNGIGNLPWLAFCSGPYLKQRVPVIPLPAPSGYFRDNVSYDRRQVFNDELGLPSSVDFFLPRKSPGGSKILYSPDGVYRVVESTNFLGWTFPLKFEVRQSTGPGGGDGVAIYDGAELIIVGHVTSIQQGRMPSIPTGPPGAASPQPKADTLNRFNRFGR